MPLVWDLSCPRKSRSRRTLFQDGIASLRLDPNTRRVDNLKPSANLFRAKVYFWSEAGPKDRNLLSTLEEFGPGTNNGAYRRGNPPAPPPLLPIPPHGLGSTIALDFETAARSLSMGCTVPFQMLSNSAVAVGNQIHQAFRESIIPNFMASAEGRSSLARSMAAPFYRARDYQGTVRRIFQVEQLPNGALPIFSRDLATSVASELRIRRRTEHVVILDDAQINFSDISFVREGGHPIIQIPKPPLPIPEWCKPGVWAFRRDKNRERLYAQVASVWEGTRAIVRHWNLGVMSRRGVSIQGRDLHEKWTLCTGPRLPRKSWWDDLDENF